METSNTAISNIINQYYVFSGNAGARTAFFLYSTEHTITEKAKCDFRKIRSVPVWNELVLLDFEVLCKITTDLVICMLWIKI